MVDDIEIVSSGGCSSFAHFAARSEPWKLVNFHAQFGLVRNNDSLLLFDTGYAARVEDAMTRFPFSLYQLALPISLDGGRSALSILDSLGLGVDNVDTIVLSHFHPDHIGGLKDFPSAKIVCSKKGWQHVAKLKGWRALKNGFVPDLIPSNFEERVTYFEDLPVGDSLPGFPDTRAMNWVGGDVTLIPLDGHVPGQIGMYIEEGNEKSTLFVADSYWNKKTLRDGVLPDGMGMSIQHNKTTYLKTLERLRLFARVCPECRLIATHDMVSSND